MLSSGWPRPYLHRPACWHLVVVVHTFFFSPPTPEVPPPPPAAPRSLSMCPVLGGSFARPFWRSAGMAIAPSGGCAAMSWRGSSRSCLTIIACHLAGVSATWSWVCGRARSSNCPEAVTSCGGAAEINAHMIAFVCQNLQRSQSQGSLFDPARIGSCTPDLTSSQSTCSHAPRCNSRMLATSRVENRKAQCRPKQCMRQRWKGGCDVEEETPTCFLWSCQYHWTVTLDKVSR